MDAEFSQWLDRIERQVRTIGRVVILGAYAAALLVFKTTPGGNSSGYGPPPWLVAMLMLFGVALYASWEFRRKPK